MTESRNYIDLALLVAEYFANDGTIDADELENLKSVALSDGVIDDNERRVLLSTLSKIKPSEMTPELKEKTESLLDLI